MAHRAIAEGARRRSGNGGWIQESHAIVGGIEAHRNAARDTWDAIGASGKAAGTRCVAAGKNGLGETGVEDETRTDAPASGNGVHDGAGVVAEATAMAERQLVNDIAVERLGDILRATAVVTDLVVGILREGPAGDGLRFGGDVIAVLAEEAWSVTQALRPSVINLGLEAASQTLLQDGLQSIVVADAVGKRETALAGQREQLRVEERAGRDGAVGVQLILLQHDDVAEVLIVLADITDLNGGGIAELMLDIQVPFLLDRWADVDVKSVGGDAREANRSENLGQG